MLNVINVYDQYQDFGANHFGPFGGAIYAIDRK